MQLLQTLISSIADSKCLFVFALLFSATQANAIDKQWLVKDRDGKNLVDDVRTLTDLTNDQELDGKYIRVVLGEAETPIRFSDDPAIVHRAATVYYHLMIAHNYFANNPLFQKDLFLNQINQKITVRVEEIHAFSSAIHFKANVKNSASGNDFSTFFSSSLTVPPSDPNLKADSDLNDNPIADWGPEIWYMKSEPRVITSTTKQVAQAIDQPAFKSGLRNNLLYGDLLNLGNEISATQGHPEWIVDGLDMLVSIGLSEVIPGIFDLIASLIPSNQQIDTALIPEISYHEYTHVVLGKVFQFAYSTALNEGFPNYFAYKISGLAKLAARTGGLSHNMAPKSIYNRDLYSWDQEFRTWAAQGSFAMSLLAELDEAFGAEGEAILVATLDPAVMSKNSLLKPNFMSAVTYAINKVAKDPLLMYLKARKVFVDRGMQNANKSLN